MSITLQSRSATAESEKSGMTNGRISVTNIVYSATPSTMPNANAVKHSARPML